MVIIFFILLSIAVVLIVGLSAHFAHKEPEKEATPDRSAATDPR